ncbi:WhiB family transcriptional regulator [Micromonospora craterilacus]|uniref:WhiB family transcriptional regulator n=1 Tax=Micromonospora craterilacus TaxID=1655439 RepID=A0A2W2CZ89_9ACTN|nr:WhiB family transcriptional regulator [Micromonospora craterilacus]PZG04856.1 WhiB family transcriptional regulator [Micromonospora craterilacus]
MTRAPRGVGTRSLAPDFLAGDPEVRPKCAGADPDLFFTDGTAAFAAKTYCRPCPLRPGCRAWALEQGNDLYGVWAGTTQAQRKQLRRMGAS